MRPALLGVLAASQAIVRTMNDGGPAVTIPAGVSTVDIYQVYAGGAGAPSPDAIVGGAGGAGGSCNWGVGVPVAGHATVGFFFGSLVWDGNFASFISLPNNRTGGAGGAASGAGGVNGGGGGAPATELGNGAAGTSVGGVPAANSVLSPYIGGGGNGAVGGGAPGNGGAWGGGGGGASATGGNYYGTGAPGGVLLIFR